MGHIMGGKRLLGAAIALLALAGIAVYAWLVFLSPWSLLTLQATGFIAVAAILGFLAWVGYVMASTPPPRPLEEIQRRLDEIGAGNK